MQLDDNPDRGRKVWLTESEVDRLMSAIEETDVRIGLRLMADCGLRTKEALEATPGDVQPMDGADGFKLRVQEGKGDQYRETWLPGDLAEQIRMYAAPDMADLEADEPLIRVSRRTFLRRLQTAREKLQEETGDDGWQYLSAHDLRRTWGTHAIEAGVLPTVVMQAGGWDDFETFQDHYMGIHGDRVVSREAAKVLG